MDGGAAKREITLRVAFDIGGTFTDVIIAASNGNILKYKILTLPESIGLDVARCVAQAVKDVGGARVDGIAHGTTVCSNAVLEGTGALTGLITTRGFRDELELRRLGRPGVYDIEWTRSKPLIPRRRRLEVTERLFVSGEEDQPLNRSELQEAITKLEAMNVESIAVSFLHSFSNPQHELQAVALIREMLPNVRVCASHEILPEIREYERTSTTSLNAYLMPVVDRYLAKLEMQLQSFHPKLLVMQSNGGLMTSDRARLHPVHMIESGPAAGVLSAAALAREMGLKQVVAFDMGGTSAKACLIENGEAIESADYEVGAGINIGGRLTKGVGYALSVPAFDIAEVGAGGGSIAWLDDGGALRVGPSSAGAVPGPACYARGGTDPTITDANVVLGYMDPSSIAGGAVALDADAAAHAITGLASALQVSLSDTAFGIHQIANATMARAIRAVTSERGRNPRDCVMVAFGGAGPIHAAHLAEEIGISHVCVPLSPGLFCALGLLVANMRYDLVSSFPAQLDAVEPNAIQKACGDMIARLGHDVQGPSSTPMDWEVQQYIDLHYEGQFSKLTMSIPQIKDGQHLRKTMSDAFHLEHERTYGYRRTIEPVCIANLRIRATARTRSVDFEAMVAEFHNSERSGSRDANHTREAYFGPQLGRQPARILTRSLLMGRVVGPVILDEFDTTVLVPPGWSAELDSFGNIVLEANDETSD